MAALLLAAALVAASCGGGDDASTSDTTAPETTTTTTSTTTTTVPRPDADPTTALLAVAATLQPDDFPDGWSAYSEGKTRELDASSCSYREDGPEATLPNGASHIGPTMQLGDEPGFITSSSYVFATEEDAVEWIETVRSDEWAECTTESFAEFQREQETGIEMSLETRDIEHLGEDGFEAFTEMHGRDGDNVSLVVNVMHYRNGRVVIEDTLERSNELDDEQWAAVDSGHSEAVNAMWNRLNEARPNG